MLSGQSRSVLTLLASNLLLFWDEFGLTPLVGRNLGSNLSPSLSLLVATCRNLRPPTSFSALPLDFSNR